MNLDPFVGVVFYTARWEKTSIEIKLAYKYLKIKENKKHCFIFII